MMIVESDGPPSWSLDASETGESTKYPWVGVVEGTAGEKIFFRPITPTLLTSSPLPTGILYSPPFRVSVNCPSESEKLHCLDTIQINEAIEATKLQPLTKDSMEQQRSADGEQEGL